jgi:hypothetical protein
MSKHTPGPWRWELNEAHKSLSLVGGRPRFDLTIIQPIRWGMGSATLFVRDTAEDGINLLYKLHERRDWIAPFPGREHHAAWCKGAKHPDLTLIEAAPDLLAALEEADDLLRIARGAMLKLGLNGLGSDCRLSHEVRMFALDFSAESRDGPGVLQVNGTGRLQKALASIRAAIAKAEGKP